MKLSGIPGGREKVTLPWLKGGFGESTKAGQKTQISYKIRVALFSDAIRASSLLTEKVS